MLTGTANEPALRRLLLFNNLLTSLLFLDEIPARANARTT